ncbi:hypothetical protein ACF07W_28505 [Streptomyces sp. NPDC015140]|uniref:hypothetical protein n=1 Tax=Streptomyces sp. NPDC015140 TaxID=3364943 RepID=UPI0036F9B67B
MSDEVAPAGASVLPEVDDVLADAHGMGDSILKAVRVQFRHRCPYMATQAGRLTEVQPILHQEFDVTVVAVQRWGLAVQFQNGTPGLIDNTKDPDWPRGKREALVGQVLHAAVLDDERTPVRLSALEADLAIARVKRAALDE